MMENSPASHGCRSRPQATGSGDTDAATATNPWPVSSPGGPLSGAPVTPSDNHGQQQGRNDGAGEGARTDLEREEQEEGGGKQVPERLDQRSGPGTALDPSCPAT